MIDKNEIKSILIIGIAGGLAQITTKVLQDQYPNANILGIDSRPVHHLRHLDINAQTIHYTRGNFEKLFRNNQFQVVYHLARMSHASIVEKNDLAKRLDLGIVGTNKILDLSLNFDVKKIIILSTFHVYGALADNGIFLTENSPLKASIKHPELRDVVEMDQLATNWMWQHKSDIETIVLRPCNIIGPQIKNAMSLYLANHYLPYPIDYNPMFQFIHEYDMANILVNSLEFLESGIYNVAPHEFISLKKALKKCKSKKVPAPFSLLGPAIESLNRLVPVISPYLVDYLKFSCLIDSTEIFHKLKVGRFNYTIEDALETIRLI